MTRHRPRHIPRALRVVLALACLAAPAWAQFETRASQALPNESLGIVTGDFNHDGKLDVAVIGDYLSVLLGNGDGTFQPPVNYTALGVTIAVADFNGDGNLDLVIGNENNSVSVFLGNGDGTFQTPKVSSTTGACCSFIAVADFNGDHKMDIVVIDFSYVSVLLGNGDGTFQAPTDINYDLVLGAQQLAAGDFNNDGKPDVALVGYFGGTQNFWILLGNGDGTFQSPLTYPTRIVPGSVAVADFNGDGNLDLAIGGYLGSGVGVLLRQLPN
jgi:Tfp pilus tip-associated adhesin PilY1